MQTEVRATKPRDVVIAGFIIALVGGAALISEVWPQLDRAVPLLVGIGALAVFAVARSYAALVFGSILTGLGAGLVAADVLSSPAFDGPGAVLGLAAGFLGIWLISAATAMNQRHWWPLIPSSILAVVGSALLADAAGAALAPWLLPGAILAIGLVIMAGGYFVRRPHSA